MDRVTYLVIVAIFILVTSSLVDYGTVEMYSAINVHDGYKALIAFCLGGVSVSVAVLMETATGLEVGSGLIKGFISVNMPVPKKHGFNKFLAMIVEFGALVFAAAQFDSAITLALNLHFTSLLFKLLVTFLAGTLGVFATVFFAMAFDPSQSDDELSYNFVISDASTTQ